VLLRLRVRLTRKQRGQYAVFSYVIVTGSSYGTNYRVQQADFGPVRQGEVYEVTFAFNCWLAPDSYSVTVAIHSRDGRQLLIGRDGVLFFQVMSATAHGRVATLMPRYDKTDCVWALTDEPESIGA